MLRLRVFGKVAEPKVCKPDRLCHKKNVASRIEQRELHSLNAKQRGLERSELVTSGRGRRGRHTLAGSWGQKSLPLRHGKIVSVVRGFNAAQEVPNTDGRKAELYFAMSSFLRLGDKHNDVGIILHVDEKQDSGLFIAEPSDSVFAGRMRLAGGYKRKGYLDQDFIRLLGFRGKGKPGEDGQEHKNAQE